ncbi:MAG: hypothetical protein HY080_14845 [Gammaproteobacteria bacterium]|nr:hypothetical protein [Gammaproteobacteria bacterium]
MNPFNRQAVEEEFDHRPSALSQWLVELPRASIGKTAELLFNALRYLNQRQLAYGDRFRTLESLREPVYYVTSNIKKHYIGVAHPLPEKTLRISEACRGFYEALASGYRKVIEDTQTANGFFLDKKIQTSAAHRCVTYLGQALLNSYEVYAAFHQDNWSRLHAMYAIAEAQDYHEIPTADDIYQKKRKTTLKDKYLRILLLYLAQPYHLRQGEISRVYHQLDDWHGLASLDKPDAQDLRLLEGQHIVLLGSDYPPEVARLPNLTAELNNYRIINTTRLVDALKTELQQSSHHAAQNQTQAVTDKNYPDLLRRLIVAWGQLHKRKFSRQQIVKKLAIRVGVHQIHKQLVNETVISNQQTGTASQHGDDLVGLNQVAHYESIDIQAVNSEKDDIWSSVYPALNFQKQETTPATTALPDIHNPGDADDWTLLNLSPEGFCLMCVTSPEEKLQVGELIALKYLRQAESSAWSLGIIRWMKSYPKSGIELGGQLLSPCAIPIGLVQPGKEEQQEQVNRGLLLPAIAAIERPASIVTTAFFYRVGDVLCIKQLHQPDTLIQLARIIGKNGLIQQFQFAVLNPQSSPEQDATSMELKLEHLGEVWRLI